MYQYEDLKECVSLDKMKDHFIFTVELVGASSPQDLVSMGWDVIVDKFDHFIGAHSRTVRRSNEHTETKTTSLLFMTIFFIKNFR